jgi:hypothetical protein
MRPSDNPFRSDAIESLPFEPQGTTWGAIWSRLSALHRRGAIIGPHGSGKTTLLDAIDRRLAADGFVARRVTLRDRFDWRTCAELLGLVQGRAGADVWLIDGFDMVPWVLRQVIRVCSHRAAGLIVTAHDTIGLLVLLETRTSAALVERLAARLGGAAYREDAARLFESCRGDIRAVFRSLYDQAAGIG